MAETPFGEWLERNDYFLGSVEPAGEHFVDASLPDLGGAIDAAVQAFYREHYRCDPQYAIIRPKDGGSWRFAFGFERAADAVLFKLTFLGQHSSG